MLRAAAAAGRPVLGQQGRWLASKAGAPMIMKADIQAYGEGSTTLVSKEKYRFLVDEPPKLGGKGLGPNPLSVLLGSLVGCTQYTCNMIAKELQLGDLGAVAWSAAGEYDLAGVRGGDPSKTARFRRIQVEGTFDTGMSQEELDRIAEQVDRRCIVAATLKASGMDLQLHMKKGAVDHQCEPACALHDLEAQGPGATGRVEGGRPSVEADAPRFQGQHASARGFATLASRGLHTSTAASWPKDGEDVAREHMDKGHDTPQLQRSTSDKGASSTAGGAYASRDDPRAQAAQPTEGKSDEQIVQEQTAGNTASPRTAGAAEAGEPMAPQPHQPVKEGKGVSYEPSGSKAPPYAGASEAAEAEEDERLEEEAGKDVNDTEYKPWDS